MGFRFRRSVKLLPGVRLNFSKSGVSTTVGRRGASVNVGKRGAHVNLGVPGSGVGYRGKIGGAKARRAAAAATRTARPRSRGCGRRRFACSWAAWSRCR